MTLNPYIVPIVSGPVASATTETYDVPTRGRRGLIVINSVTAPANGFSETLSILGVSASGLTWVILSAVALTATGQQVLQVGPGLVAVANQAVSAVLPATVRISVTHTDATQITRSIELQLTP